MGRILLRHSCVEPACAWFSTKWDVLGRIAQVTYPDRTGKLSSISESVDYGYDAAGRVNLIGTYVRGASYAADDQLEEIRFGNGVVQTMGYDPKRRWLDHMQVVGLSAGLSTLLSSSTLKHDADARVLSDTRTGLVTQQRAFTYDPSGRLLTTTGAHPDSFEYDLAGNILSRKSVGVYTYLDAGHPNAVTAAGALAYAYDDTGRLVKRNGFQVQWDPLDRLANVATAAGVVTFTYSAEGNLSARTTSKGTQRFHGNLAEVDAEGAFTFNYLIGDQVFAQRRPSAGVLFFHRDGLGSVSEITDQSGTAVQIYTYSPWGASKGNSELSNDQRFAGGREDSDSGLVQLGARALDPVLARFTSPDKTIPNPYRPAYLNRYIYARNNPVNVVDPSGFGPPDEQYPLVNEAIDQLKRTLEPLGNMTFIAPLPAKKPVARDPSDAMFEMLRPLVESLVPVIQILKLEPLRGMGRGFSGTVGGGLCLVLCVANLEIDFGLYFSPPSRENDVYFNDVHAYMTLGGSFLSVSPNSGVDILSPDLGYPSNSGSAQLAFGVGASMGASGSVFLTEASNAGAYSEFARSLSVGLGPVTLSGSVNQSNQWTGTAAYGYSVGFPTSAYVYNTYTWTTGGVLNWLAPKR